MLHLTSSCINYCFPPSSEKEGSKQTNKTTAIFHRSLSTSPSFVPRLPVTHPHVPRTCTLLSCRSHRGAPQTWGQSNHMGKSSSSVLLNQGSLSGHQKHETQLSAGAMSQPMSKRHTGQCQQQLGLNFVPQVLFQAFELQKERRIKVTTELLSPLSPERSGNIFRELQHKYTVCQAWAKELHTATFLQKG